MIWLTGWTRDRARALKRRADGTFKSWKPKAGKKKGHRETGDFHGIKTHIGKEFERQKGRVAKLGDIVRTKKSDGTYHRGAFWYIKTKKGWRRFGLKKPTRAQIIKACVVGIKLYTGDIPGAAKELGVSQATVTKAIKARAPSTVKRRFRQHEKEGGLFP